MGQTPNLFSSNLDAIISKQGISKDVLKILSLKPSSLEKDLWLPHYSSIKLVQHSLRGSMAALLRLSYVRNWTLTLRWI